MKFPQFYKSISLIRFSKLLINKTSFTAILLSSILLIIILYFLANNKATEALKNKKDENEDENKDENQDAGKDNSKHAYETTDKFLPPAE